MAFVWFWKNLSSWNWIYSFHCSRLSVGGKSGHTSVLFIFLSDNNFSHFHSSCLHVGKRVWRKSRNYGEFTTVDLCQNVKEKFGKWRRQGLLTTKYGWTVFGGRGRAVCTNRSSIFRRLLIMIWIIPTLHEHRPRCTTTVALFPVHEFMIKLWNKLLFFMIMRDTLCIMLASDVVLVTGKRNFYLLT